MNTSRRQPLDEEQDQEPDGGKMGFLEHLDELRSRIIRCCIAILAGTIVSFAFEPQLAEFLLEPSRRILPEDSVFIFTRWGEAFSFHFNVALIGGLLLSAPFIAFQIWGFIAPGLYANEKRFAVPFVVLTSLCAVGGALFTHYVVFPTTMKFFAAFDSPDMKFLPRIEDTFDQYIKLMIGMVLVFQMPTIVFFLARMGMVTARFLWVHIKYAVLIIFIVAALLTSSPDVWTQTVFATPMLGLYLVSIAIAWLAAPRRKDDADDGSRGQGTHLRLIVAASVIEHARRHADPGRSLRLIGRPRRQL